MTEPVDSCRISCGLSPAQLSTRLAHIRRILNRHPHQQIKNEHGCRLIFEADADLEAQLRDLIRLERQCCPFLKMTLERQGQKLILEVAGDNNARDQIAELFG